MRRIPAWQSAQYRFQYSNRYYGFFPPRVLRNYIDKFDELLSNSVLATILFYAGLPPLAGYIKNQCAGISTTTKSIPETLDRAKEGAQTKIKAVEERGKGIAQTNLKAIEERVEEIAQTKLKPVKERAKEIAKMKLKAFKEGAKDITEIKLKKFKERAKDIVQRKLKPVEERAKDIAQRKIKAVEERGKEIANTIKNAPASNTKVLEVKAELEKLVEERAKEIARMELKSAKEKQELEYMMRKERVDKLEMAPKGNWEDEVVYYSIVGACLWMVLSKFLNSP